MTTTGNRHPASTLRPCVRAGPLAPNGKAATVSRTTVAADVDQPSDVQVDLTTEVAFHPFLAVHDLTNAGEVHLREISHTGVCRHAGLVYDIFGLVRPYPVDVLKRDFNTLVIWNVDSGDYGHTVPPIRQCAASGSVGASLALPLLVPEIFTHYHYTPLAPDNPALSAPLPHGCRYFHLGLPTLTPQ